jgi:type I restriction enzyme R subunit
MTSLLKPVAKRYSELIEDKRIKFRETIRNFNKWYSYIIQIVRMFDKDLQKEYVFTAYLEKLLPNAVEEPMDLVGKLKLTYYKLAQTFIGEITLNPTGDENKLVPPKTFEPVSNAEDKNELLENIIARINERFKGIWTEGDTVITETIFNRCIKNNKKLAQYAKKNDQEIFEQSIFPDIFKKIAQECYKEQATSFSKLFEDKNFYEAVMNEIGKGVYKDLRSRK